MTGPKRGSKRPNWGPIPTKKRKKVEKSARFRLAYLNISALKPPWRWRQGRFGLQNGPILPKFHPKSPANISAMRNVSNQPRAPKRAARRTIRPRVSGSVEQAVSTASTCARGIVLQLGDLLEVRLGVVLDLVRAQGPAVHRHTLKSPQPAMTAAVVVVAEA